MDKCWFVLRQRHPAPVYTEPGMAFGAAEGPIRLGHFVADPKELDQVINTEDITPFPRNMRIWATGTAQFCLSQKESRVHDNGIVVNLPIATAVGATVSAEARAVFRRIMGEQWDIERLDTQIVQPTEAYLEQCSQSEQLAMWVKKHKRLGAWKAYMISGIMIAHGAKYEHNNGGETGAKLGGGVDLFGAAGVNANIENMKDNGISMGGEIKSNFVFAVRLTEVSKAMFRSNIKQKTITKGTVFAAGPRRCEVAEMLTGAGLAGANMHNLEVVQGEDLEYMIQIKE
ncbi:hypothetical protein PG993_011649 [Apiospora rasikravindrae]|uniref:Uncharacterized protein n=1 Tax=Apiospora rasikravindrae TaxID=990691 RepID=A0ABR1S0B6_9PEZI